MNKTIKAQKDALCYIRGCHGVLDKISTFRVTQPVKVFNLEKHNGRSKTQNP